MKLVHLRDDLASADVPLVGDDTQWAETSNQEALRFAARRHRSWGALVT